MDSDVDLGKSREVYDYCKEHGIDTDGQLPEVRNLSGNILLEEKIIGHYGERITIYED